VRISLAVLLFLIGVIALASGCASPGRQDTSKASGNQVFEFSSGGAYHIAGSGEWQVRLDSAGAFSIAHNVRGVVKDYGVFSLAEKESVELWGLVRTANIGEMESSKRPGLPDEVQYTFALGDGTPTRSVKIWVTDARQNDRLVALVERIGTLIEKYTRQKPILN